MIELFGDNVRFELRTGIEDLQNTLKFLTKNKNDTCIGYRLIEGPYAGYNEKPKKVPTLEVLKYEESKENPYNAFLSPLLPEQMYEQINAWLLEQMKEMPRHDEVFSDVVNHPGFTIRAGWFDISMMKIKFQIWPTAILYGK